MAGLEGCELPAAARTADIKQKYEKSRKTAIRAPPSDKLFPISRESRCL